MQALRAKKINSFVCCDRTFRSYATLDRHVKIDHPEITVSDSDSPSHSSLSEIQGTSRDIPMVDVESSTESETQSASRDFPMEDIEASAEPEVLDIEEPGFDEDFDYDVIFINEAEPEEEPEDIVPISSDRVDSEFLMDVKKTLSDADYALFEATCQRILGDRVLHNATGKSIHYLSSFYLNAFCNNPTLSNYALRMADSSYLQEKFAMTNPLHIQPKPFRLDNKKSYYYIPIRELLVKYILNDDLVRIINQETTTNVTPYVRNNGFNGKLRLMIYGDEFGICNPLRDSSKKYKVYVLYLDIDNRQYTSKKKDIHLLMIWCPDDLKNSNQSLLDIMSPLSEDFLCLFRDGISYALNDRQIHIPVCLSHIVGDNLSVAELLGLRRSFGYAFACRHCGIPHTRLSSLDDTSTHLAIHNSYDSYKNEVNSVLSIKNFASPYGITCRSAFDKLGINVFQIAPADIFHDLAEGVISTIIAKVFEILKVKLGSDTVRNRFKSFKIWVNGKLDINFQPKTIKIRGKGWQKIELAVRLVEIFPEMMENPSDYAIYFHLRKVIFFVFSPSMPNICELRSSVREFIRLCHENGLATPKVHFISHYPELTEFYGPLSRFSTDKYERVHSYLKNLLSLSKNFLNVPYSLSKRNQMAQPFLHVVDKIYDEGILSSSHYPFPLGRSILRSLLSNDCYFIEARQFAARDSEVFVRGKLWKVTDRNIESNVHKLELNLDSNEIPLAGLSHLNSYLFKFQGSYFVNYSMMK